MRKKYTSVPSAGRWTQYYTTIVDYLNCIWRTGGDSNEAMV